MNRLVISKREIVEYMPSLSPAAKGDWERVSVETDIKRKEWLKGKLRAAGFDLSQDIIRSEGFQGDLLFTQYPLTELPTEPMKDK